VQYITLVLLIFAVVCSIVALSTHQTIFYRLLNAVPFTATVYDNTVELGTTDTVRMYFTIALYALLLLLECWFIYIIHKCYGYLIERRRYMNYCLTYSTPMRTVHMRVPWYSPLFYFTHSICSFNVSGEHNVKWLQSF
jgi:hypothetical protein